MYSYFFGVICIAPPRAPDFKVIGGCDVRRPYLIAQINFEDWGVGGRAQNFVVLPWRISRLVDNNKLKLLELSSGF